MSSISDLSVASCSSPSSYLFQEKEAFKDIEELVFLSYYKEFKLLLCSSCFLAIYPSISAFKSHLLRDLKLVPLELRTSIISRALEIFKGLKVASSKESLELIKAFSTSRNIPAFQELKLIDLFICNSCFKIVSSKATIRKHCSLEHKNSEINPIYKAIKGQGLEATRFFFEIKSNLNLDRKSTRLNSSHYSRSRMPSSA